MVPNKFAKYRLGQVQDPSRLSWMTQKIATPAESDRLLPTLNYRLQGRDNVIKDRDVPLQRCMRRQNQDPVVGRYGIAEIKRDFAGFAQTSSGGAIGDGFFRGKLQLGGFENTGHPSRVACRGLEASRVPRMRALPPLSRMFLSPLSGCRPDATLAIIRATCRY